MKGNSNGYVNPNYQYYTISNHNNDNILRDECGNIHSFEEETLCKVTVCTQNDGPCTQENE